MVYVIHHTDILGNAKKVGCESDLFYLQTKSTNITNA